MKKKINKLITQFPSIFRFIPESKFIKKVLKSKPLVYILIATMSALCMVLILGIIFLLLMFYKNFENLSTVVNQRKSIESKINFWQSITQKYDGYKDAYFQIAILEYKLGDFNKSKNANNKALLLDPNFEDAKKLERLLNKKD